LPWLNPLPEASRKSSGINELHVFISWRTGAVLVAQDLDSIFNYWLRFINLKGVSGMG
jgi:hypothetical protein